MDDVALVIGEALMDVVRADDGTTTEHPGGSAANVAVALARLGRPVRFATALAEDERGELLAAHLAKAGVTLAGDPVVLPRTSTAVATIGADGSARYEFDVEWRLGELSAGEPRFVHVGSLGAVLAPGADDVLRLLRALPEGATVCYDVNARPALTGAGPDVVRRVEMVAGCADLVKASDEDLAALYPTRTFDGAAEHLLGLGPNAVVVTRGMNGATWFSHQGPVSIEASPTAVVDTIGAGDTFSAAVVDALWEGLAIDPRLALRHAARAAAVTVSRAGADPPYRHELR